VRFCNVKDLGFFLVIAACGISLLSLKYFPVPYFWIALSWLLVAIYGLVLGFNSTIKVVSVNVGVVIMALGIFEGYLSHKASNPTLRYVYEEGYYARDELLGTAPGKRCKGFSAHRYFKKELLYHVVYTIDSHGLRTGPPTNNSNENATCVLFFGCSFTFGEGLNDEETMPYLVGVKSKGKYCTYNFGFHGYGPHQMLALLEHCLEEKITGCKPKYAIYQALMDHVRRSSGLVSYGQYGPRYVLNPNGQVIFVGRFIDNKNDENGMIARIIDQFKKSFVLKATLFKERSINSDDVNLFVAIVDRAKTILEARYPGIKFYVLFWDKFYDEKETENREKLLRGLYHRGIRVHLISNVLKDNEKSKYIIEKDGHPNAFANELIAEYVINNILGK
jgi:hypothetical protein